MKKIMTLCLLCALLLSTLCACTLPSLSNPDGIDPGPQLDLKTHHKILVADQKNKRLAIYDLNDDDWTKPLWTWTTDDPHFTNVDGMKYRYDPHSQTEVIAVCSSGGYCAVVAYPTGEVLSYVPSAGGNPHSVEVLPDGAFAVAASTGNYLRIYDTTNFGDVSKKYTQITIPDAHGVLWDEDEEILWVLGDLKLYAVAVDKEHNMTVLENMSIGLIGASGHDLQPDYSDPDKDLLWVTVGSQFFQIRKSTRETIGNFPGHFSVAMTANVKGIGTFADGTLVMAVANGTQEEWNTDRVTVGLYDEEEDRYYLSEREIPNAAIYKLRVLEKKYK